MPDQGNSLIRVAEAPVDAGLTPEQSLSVEGGNLNLRGKALVSASSMSGMSWPVYPSQGPLQPSLSRLYSLI